jgi:hypothetical protein
LHCFSKGEGARRAVWFNVKCVANEQKYKMMTEERLREMLAITKTRFGVRGKGREAATYLPATVLRGRHRGSCGTREERPSEW